MFCCSSFCIHSGSVAPYLLTAHFLWHGMNKDVKDWASICLDCQRLKIAKHGGQIAASTCPGLEECPLEASGLSSAVMVLRSLTSLPGQVLFAKKIPPDQVLDSLYRLMEWFQPPLLIHSSLSQLARCAHKTPPLQPSPLLDAIDRALFLPQHNLQPYPLHAPFAPAST